MGGGVGGEELIIISTDSHKSMVCIAQERNRIQNKNSSYMYMHSLVPRHHSQIFNAAGWLGIGNRDELHVG